MRHTIVEKGLDNHPEMRGLLEFALYHGYLTEKETTILSTFIIAAEREEQEVDDSRKYNEIKRALAPLVPKFERAYRAYQNQRRGDITNLHLTIVESIIVSMIVASQMYEAHYSMESTLLGMALTFAGLLVLYKSKLGVILSIAFSGFWGWLAGHALNVSKVSAISTIATGVIVAAASYFYHEWKRDPAGYRAFIARQEQGKHQKEVGEALWGAFKAWANHSGKNSDQAIRTGTVPHS